MRAAIASVVGVLFCLGLAACVSFPALAADALTNDSVIEMVKLGLSEAVIVKKIKSGPVAFDTELSGLKALKAAGVSDAIIEAMMAAGESAEAAASAKAAEEAARPAWIPKKSGIYVDRAGGGGTPTLERIEPSTYDIDQGSGFATRMFSPAKTKTRIRIIGAASATTVSGDAEFYFVLDSSKEKADDAPANDPMSQAVAMVSQMQQGNSATSPKQFALVKLEQKKGSREFVAGAYNAFGATSGVEDKAVIQFDVDEVADGVYKVRPRETLANGEYCFYFGSANPKLSSAFAGNPNSVYDFSRR